MPLTKNQKEKFAVYVHDGALEVSIDWIQDHLKPNDVFSTDDLEKWAEENGFVKEAP